MDSEQQSSSLKSLSKWAFCRTVKNNQKEGVGRGGGENSLSVRKGSTATDRKPQITMISTTEFISLSYVGLMVFLPMMPSGIKVTSNSMFYHSYSIALGDVDQPPLLHSGKLD